MNKITIFIYLLLFLTQSLASQSDLNKDWLNKDLKIFKNILHLLETDEINLYTIEQIEGILVSEGYIYGNLGLGYRVQTFVKPGGYSRFTIRILLDQNNIIIKHRITITTYTFVMEDIEQEINILPILSQFNTEIIDRDHIRLVLENIKEEQYLIMQNIFFNYFGVSGNIQIPYNLYNDYLLLMDPFNEDYYGFISGSRHIVPRSRIAIENIKNENNYDLLMLIMASPNPTARIYAIETISNGNIENIIDYDIYLDIINKLIKLRIPIRAVWSSRVITITIDSIESINTAMNYISIHL
jgi:hypothetical protein